MSRPSPQEQAEIDAASERRDCRKCALHGGSAMDGESVRCNRNGQTYGPIVPPDRIASSPCLEFKPASPPVSADREGTADALPAMRAGADAAKWSHVWRCSGCGEMRPAREATGPRWTWACDAWEHQCDASHREPARDFGPAVEDPRDATIRDLRARVGRYLPLSLREDPSDETIRDWYERTQKYEDGLRALLGRCATEIAALLALDSYHNCVCGRGHRAMPGATLERMLDLSSALRSAGVEPTAEAQEGEASRPEPIRHGETCPKAEHVGTGYLHDASADGPYDVDGLTYCGRCHGAIDR